MFINYLDIEEFRGIKSCKKRIKFSNFTVLIGRNSSGKSTILEALSLLPHPDVVNEIDGNIKFGSLMQLHPGPFKRLLYLYAGISRLHYDFKNFHLKIEIKEGSAHAYVSNELVDYMNIAKFYGTESKYLSNFVIFIPDTTDILDKLENKISHYQDALTKAGYNIKLAEILNEFVNDQYSEIVFLSPISLRKVYSDKKTAYLRFSELGSGAEKVIKIIAFLEVYSPELVIIDDFEARLHPTLIKLFLRWLKNKNCQTIISTHSIDVLYHLVDINPDDTTIVQLSKSNDDILSHKSLRLEELEDLLNANLDPRSLVDKLGL